MKTTEVRLPIIDLAGASCAGRVERAFLALPGVVRASARLGSTLASVGYDPARVRLDDLGEVVRRAGRGVARWERAALRIRAAGYGARRRGDESS